jgi:hypothetical protein
LRPDYPPAGAAGFNSPALSFMSCLRHGDVALWLNPWRKADIKGSARAMALALFLFLSPFNFPPPTAILLTAKRQKNMR